jgi:formate C-acetyltransferase
VTESYRETQGLPYVLRRAKALDKILREMDICIAPSELIAGSYAGKPRGCQVYPEYDMKFVIDELDTFEMRKADRFIVSEETKTKLRQIYKDWEGNTIADNALGLFPIDAKESALDGIFLLTALRSGVGHMIVDYPLLLNEGISGIRRKIQDCRKKPDYCVPDYGNRLIYYAAAEICCDAIIAFSNRFADLAERQLKKEKDLKRKNELALIAENCRRVPENPPENFHQALQSFWILHLALHLESSGHSVSPGRFDQYMYPFYKKDIEAGNMSEDNAEELLHALWLKFFELNKVRDKVTTLAFSGYPMFQNLNLGGQDIHGRSAVNPLSHLCLDATVKLRLPQPSLSVRWFYGCPDDFFLHALKAISLGTGLPALFNDEILIPNMLQMGYSLEESRDYGIVGCTESVGQGNVEPWLTGGLINSLKPLELIIFNGYDPVLRKTRKIITKPAEETESFEEFFAAYLDQLFYYLDQNILCDNILDTLHGKLCPTPLESVFTNGCVESGKTNLEGGAKYNSSTIEVVGMPNAADALAAIDTLVYREKKITWAELKEALLSDYEGFEHIHGMLLNHCPKYGNDNDYVDGIAGRIVDALYEHADKYRSPRGGKYRIALYSISSHILFAGNTGATPDGRKYGEVLADGGISCAQGRDSEGITALLNTIVKMDSAKALGSTLLNVKLSPELFKGDGIRAVADLIKTYFLKKGQHIQFNVVDAKTLRDARKNPEKYPLLMVRVAGFSVLFNTIEEQLQNDIIMRTEHNSRGTVC